MLLFVSGCNRSEMADYAWLQPGEITPRGWLDDQLTTQLGTPLLSVPDSQSLNAQLYINQLGNRQTGGYYGSQTYTLEDIEKQLDGHLRGFHPAKNLFIGDLIEPLFLNAFGGLQFRSLEACAGRDTQLAGASISEDCEEISTRISNKYLQALWMKSGDELVKMLYGPNELNTTIKEVAVQIVEEGNYPFDLGSQLRLVTAEPVEFTFILRKPSWAVDISIKSEGAEIIEERDHFRVTNTWFNSIINIRYSSKINDFKDPKGNYYFTHGPLTYSLPLEVADSMQFTTYPDSSYQIDLRTIPGFLENDIADQPWSSPNMIDVNLYNPVTKETISAQMVPMASSFRRITSFPPRLFD